ncbi:hypothetical protein BDV59DRAFT_205434 [Aspergillus ambiguus]|uniref:uncharacterized protein n=1 Tax=Aspergillus ambiguus TaxID=176160 RepID=UPI003CCE2C24
MESTDPTSLSVQGSDHSSGSSNCSYCDDQTSLPLLSYHRDRHHQASPHLIRLFRAGRGLLAPEQGEEAAHEINTLNEDIRRLNRAHFRDENLGTIDTDIFQHAWKSPGSMSHLRDFCERRHYPAAWACIPPQPGDGYLPGTNALLDECSWRTAGSLLNALWTLQKAAASRSIVEDVRGIIGKLQRDLNRLILSGSDIPRAVPVNLEHVADVYGMLIACLEDDQRSLYEQGREHLRKDCLLYGYPEGWVPEAYDVEKLEEYLEL